MSLERNKLLSIFPYDPDMKTMKKSKAATAGMILFIDLGMPTSGLKSIRIFAKLGKGCLESRFAVFAWD